MSIKVIILAGGWGTRLGQLGEHTPKPMVNIGSKPILWHIMKIYAHYGFKDFIISSGVKSHVIKDYFMNYEIYSRDFSKDFSTGEVIYKNYIHHICFYRITFFTRRYIKKNNKN